MGHMQVWKYVYLVKDHQDSHATGATKAGGAPFLAQTNPVYSQPTYVANTPLVTSLPISGEPHDRDIFGWMGTLTYVFSSTELPLLRMELI